MYGGYGGLSSYGGMGGLGSSYGSYGSSYGGYGSSYGGYRGIDNRIRQGNTTQSTSAVSKEIADGKDGDPGKPQDLQQKEQQQKEDKRVVQEWFKMMGGLRSILELGVAFLALANFCMTTSELVKKFMAYTKEKSLSIAKFVEGKIPTKTITKLMAPERRQKTIRWLLIGCLRVLALALLVIGVKMRRQIKSQSRRRQQEMEKQLSELRENEVQMQDESVIEARHIGELTTHDANL